jgi:hypothetical protein
MSKIWWQAWLNASLCEMGKVVERGFLGGSLKNCGRPNSAFSGTLWGISHD